MILLTRGVRMTIVFKVSDNIKEEMIKYYQDKKRSKTPPYAIFQADEADTNITLYESGKVVFQGLSADIDANMWKDLERSWNNRDINAEETKKEDKKNEEKDTRQNCFYFCFCFFHISIVFLYSWALIYQHII